MILIQLNDTHLSLDVLLAIWEPMQVLYYEYAVHED
jgi:hypothetical protein